ncbi:hypothetical protein [Novosphingobium sp. MD-1]|uniref:hypothetical protein n=1 Tax=Novosphingobium sp. MD-1 TaxID=1630648 RepID=UPI000F7D5F96|nr:hypothetical protein [Novosphingobium sp. MD-1]
MKVLVSLHTQFSQMPPDAVWLIESPHNRAWFNLHHHEVDANSATFRDWCEPTDIISAVIDHHPAWGQIVVEGLPLTLDLAEAFARYGEVLALQDGFTITSMKDNSH